MKHLSSMVTRAFNWTALVATLAVLAAAAAPLAAQDTEALIDAPSFYITGGYNVDAEVGLIGFGFFGHVNSRHDLWISLHADVHADSLLVDLLPVELTMLKAIPAGDGAVAYFGGGGGWTWNVDSDCESGCFAWGGVVVRAGIMKRTGLALFADVKVLTRDGETATSLRFGIGAR